MSELPISGPARLQSKRQALLASIQELEAQYEELRAEMLPLWERHIVLTEALPADLQQVRTAPFPLKVRKDSCPSLVTGLSAIALLTASSGLIRMWL